MLGQAHTPKRRLLPFVLLALGVLVAPAVGGAGRSPSQASLRAQDARIVAESRASALSLYSLDQRLASAQARLGTLAAQARTLRTERIELRHELALAHSSTRLASQRLGARLRALYEQGNVEPLEIVFGATSLDEALSALDTLSRASSQGEDVLSQLEAARTQLHDASRSLSARTAALATALGEARATTRSLEAARATRSAYIDSLAAKRRLTEQQLSALEAEVRVADVRTASLDTPAGDAKHRIATARRRAARRGRLTVDHGVRNRVLARRLDGHGTARRLGRRRGRSERDPARHPHDRSGLRRGDRRRYGRRNRRSHDRPLVPDHRSGDGLGSAHCDDLSALGTFTRPR